MKTSVPYSLKKGMVFLGVMALPFAFGGCDKDPVEPNNPDNPNNPQTVTHQFEYNKNMKFRRVGNTTYMPYDVFANDSLPNIVNKSQNIVVIDVVESEQFLGMPDVESMDARANAAEYVYNVAPNQIKAGTKTIEIRSDLYTNRVKEVFEEKLGANVRLR